MGFRKPFIIRRKVPGAYVNGVFVDGGEVQQTIMATVQPLKNEDMIDLPQGRRISDIIKVYTSEVLTTAEDNGVDKQPDRIFWKDSWFEITSTGTFQMGVISHYRYWAIRIPIGQ